MDTILTTAAPGSRWDHRTLTAKEQFLRDGKRLFRAVGKRLIAEGIARDMEVSANKAGIAVSGEVYAYFYGRTENTGIMMEISQMALFTPREDGINVMAQYRRVGPHARPRKGRYPLDQIIGANEWYFTAFGGGQGNPISEDGLFSMAARMLESRTLAHAA